MISVEATGKTIEDAIRSGLVQLGLTRDEVEVEVIAEPKSGFLGFGSKPAVVLVKAKEQAEHLLHEEIAHKEILRKEEEPEPVEEAVQESVVQPSDISPVEDDSAAVDDDSELVPERGMTADEAAAKAKAFVTEVLENMGLTAIIEKMIKHDKIILHLHGKNLGIIIGKHGKTLDALQYLTNLTTNQGQDTRHFIMLDVENYRHRREDTLKKLAVRVAGRLQQGEKKELDPMNGFERKIIHMALQNTEHIRTESEGQDPYRHVVIYHD